MKAKNNIAKGIGLSKENIIDLVNTIIRRKRLKLTICQVLKDHILSIFSYKTLKRLPLSEETLTRRRIFNKAQSMISTQFDVTNLMKMLNLNSLLLNSMLSKEE